MNNEGFTLMEVLVVSLIFALLIIASSNTFFSSVTGANKEEVLREIKQAGDFAVAQIENELRFAEEITTDCTGGPYTSIGYVGSDEEFHTLGLSADGNRIVIDGDANPLTPSTMVVSNDGGEEFVIRCSRSVYNVASVEVVFVLQRETEDNKKDEELQQRFVANVAVRNR